MFERWFRLAEAGTTVRTELVAGCITFLTMAYIIVVQPAVLSGRMFGFQTGLDFDAVMGATCLSAALASALMGLLARYPIAQAPGMGQNFLFVFTALPAASSLVGAGDAWRVALGIVFYSGVLFVVLSLTPVRVWILDAVGPGVKHGIAGGIGLFIAFIGLQNGGLIVKDPATAVKLTPHLLGPDCLVFLVGLWTAAALMARRIPGGLLWGIATATCAALALKQSLPIWPQAWQSSNWWLDSKLAQGFNLPAGLFAAPPSLAPVAFQLELVTPLQPVLWPLIGVFLFTVLFDTMGTLIAVADQAGWLQNNQLPRAREAMLSDALATTLGAALGTSTVTSYIESVAGVQHGGRTGLTSLTVAICFLSALCCAPLVGWLASYPPVITPALVIVGSLMLASIRRIDWSDASESIPAFLALVGIPFSFSIADGMALALVAQAVIKTLAGRGRELSWTARLLALALFGYFAFLRPAG